MKIVVAGGGAWGTALAAIAARRGHAAILWTRDPSVAASIQRDHRHPTRLSGAVLPEGLRASADASTLRGADILILAVPAAAVSAIFPKIPADEPPGLILSAIKGFFPEGDLTISEAVRRSRPELPFAVLSGPTFADGTLRGDPTAAVAASADDAASRTVQEALSDSRFRLYRSSDVIGVELLGALKNVVAIAAGAVSGLGFGANTLAALATRGLAEMARLVIARGGDERTAVGLAGAGDLMLTCTGRESRNRRLGELLARGATLPAALAEIGEVAEGAYSCRAAVRLADASGVEMPIALAVSQIVEGSLTAARAIENLMSRQLRAESV